MPYSSNLKTGNLAGRRPDGLLRGVELGMNLHNGMRPVHPGEILADELAELGITANALAKALAVSPNRVTTILKGQRGITADTALRLSRYFGTTPQFWLNLQQSFELRLAETNAGRKIAEQVQPLARADRQA